MPELPEVEITKKTLQKYVQDQYITCLLYTSDAADE